MEENAIDKIETSNVPVWHVMLHLAPEKIERQLQTENVERQTDGFPLLEYFIPFRFLRHAVPEKFTDHADQQERDAQETNDFRDDLRNFVFIKGTPKEVEKLVISRWNREGRLHLRFYRTRSGTKILIPDREMIPFITLCSEQRQRFTIGPPLKNIQVRESVVIRRGIFKDFPATVLDVQHTAEGISLTLGIPMFSGMKTLHLPAFRTADVRLEKGTTDLLNDHFIDNVESELLAIFRQRILRRETMKHQAKNVATLNSLFHFNYLTMSDEGIHRHFRALMLLCAILRKDTYSAEAIADELASVLGDVTEPATDEQAYIMAVLYLHTRDVRLRTAVKEYRRQQPSCPESLQRLISLISRIKNR